MGNSICAQLELGTTESLRQAEEFSPHERISRINSSALIDQPLSPGLSEATMQDGDQSLLFFERELIRRFENVTEWHRVRHEQSPLGECDIISRPLLFGNPFVPLGCVNGF